MTREPSVDQALEWIRSGFIVVAPLEHGYVYLVDAFSHDGVRAMHALRGDALGITAQVLVGSTDTLAGIARDISPEVHAMMKAFWPGLLTLNLRPQRWLSWDLGDDKELDIVCVRVPSADFVLALLAKSGPLACASAARAGAPPILTTVDLISSKNELVRVCDFGELTAGPVTSIVSVNETETTLLREGAITLEELSAYVPGISRLNSANS